MTPSEKSERERLSRTPGLTRRQRDAILDPSFALREAALLIEVLRLQGAAQQAAKPEADRELDLKMGLATAEASHAVTFDGVTQVFGGARREVPRV